jgi:Ca2+-binding RTX toxin-like protein
MADTLIGGDSADTLNGGDGNDYLTGGAGVDLLIGGDGNNIYIIENSVQHASGIVPGGETITGGAGTDVIRFTNNTADTLTLNQDVTGGTTGDTVVSVMISDASGATSGTGALNVDASLLNSDQAVSILGNDGDNALVGNDDGWSTLTGQGGNDTLVGGQYDDYLMGGVGLDSLMGDLGSDTLMGGLGSDWLDVGLDSSGNDHIVYNAATESTFDSVTGGYDVIENFDFHNFNFIDLNFLESLPSSEIGSTNGTSQLSSPASLADALNQLAAFAVANPLPGKTVLVFNFEYGSDTYVYADAHLADATYNSGDFLIKLVGVTASSIGIAGFMGSDVVILS